ncbi:MAG: ABC transporter permease [Candidatus Nanopelagicales bacterium]
MLTRRLGAALVTLLVASFVMFLLVSASVRPLEDLEESTAPNRDELIALRVAQLHLDTPVVGRYFMWLRNFVTGDLGVAWRSGEQVSSVLGHAMISTLQLVLISTILAIFLGVSIGVISALRQYSSFDYLITFTSFVLFSLPAFWVAVLLKEWGAIGFNDFLGAPSLSAAALIGVSALLGLLWMLGLGGDSRRRWISFGGAFGVTALVLLYLQITGWWSDPHIDALLTLLLGTGIGLAATVLITGLRNQRALGTALSVVVLGVALSTPLHWFFFATSDAMSWWILLGLLGVAVGSGALVGHLFAGPDRQQSRLVGMVTAVGMALLAFADQVMKAWPAYVNAPLVRGRPIATTGDRTPNLQGDFWVGVVDLYTHLLLPTAALMLISFAAYTRYSRSSMLEVLRQDYMRTARAKGLSERTVVMRHGFRNALIPLATIVPMNVIGLFGGAIITEQVFGRPGMGQLFLTSMNSAEVDGVMAYLMVTAFFAIVANIVADVIYAYLDPRIRVN